MVMFNRLIRSTRDYEWSKMTMGLHRIPSDLMPFCDELYISKEDYGTSRKDRFISHMIYRKPQLNYVDNERKRENLNDAWNDRNHQSSNHSENSSQNEASTSN